MSDDVVEVNRVNATFEIRNSGNGKGLGGFAKRKILKGEVIVAEPPLLKIPDSAIGSLDEAMHFANTEFKKLSEIDKKRVLSLFNAFPERGVSGIIQSNALPTDDGGGLFPTLARFNHACNPNANQSWISKKNEQRVYAVRDIEQGEEIFYKYIPALFMTYSERHSVLSQHFRFECKCMHCESLSQNSDKKAKSDSNRSRLASIKDDFSELENDPEEALSLLREMEELILEEGGHEGELAPFIYDTFVNCITTPKYLKKADGLIQRAHKVLSNCLPSFSLIIFCSLNFFLPPSSSFPPSLSPHWIIFSLLRPKY